MQEEFDNTAEKKENLDNQENIVLKKYFVLNHFAEEAKTFEPKVVFVDDENQISRCTNYERHGRLEDM